jgi:hypothetical protein
MSNVKAFPNTKIAGNQNIADRDLYRNFFDEVEKVVDNFIDQGLCHELMISALSIQHHILCQELLSPPEE